MFLLEKISKIDFASARWERWYSSQNGEVDADYIPSKTKSVDLAKRREWCLVHALDIISVDREICEMTEPPQCINKDSFAGCRIPGDVVGAYRRYYQAKLYSMGLMRFYHESPLPPWVMGHKTSEQNKVKLIPYQLDEEGYVVVELV